MQDPLEGIVVDKRLSQYEFKVPVLLVAEIKTWTPIQKKIANNNLLYVLARCAHQFRFDCANRTVNDNR